MSSKQSPTDTKNKPERTCLLIAGMHRSGTSLFTRTAGLLGLTMPEQPIEAGKENSSGFWESQLLVDTHDKLLSDLGSAWYDWRELQINATDSQKVFDSYRDKILSAIEMDYGQSSMFALKDPRICRFIPAFEEILKSKNITTKYLIPVRSPIEVAESLLERNGLPLSQGILLWLRHILDAEHFTRKAPRSIVAYADALQAWKPVVEKISKDIDLTWPRPAEAAEKEIEDFINPLQRHHRTDRTDLNTDIASSLEQILNWAEETQSIILQKVTNKNATRLDEIRESFNSVSPVLYMHHMNIAESAAPQHDRLHRDVYFIRNTLDEINKERTTVHHESTSAENEIPDLIKEQSKEIRSLKINLSNKHKNKIEKISLELKKSKEKEEKVYLKYKKLTEEMRDLREEHKKSLEDAEKAREAQIYAEAQCERLSENYSELLATNLPLKQKNDEPSVLAPNNDDHSDEKDDPQPVYDIDAKLKFDVVIPVYNSVHWVALCLAELVRYMPRNVAEIIVVNDRSRPDETEHLKRIIERYPEVRLIENTGTTGGFGHACNMGAKAGKSPHVVFLNTDCLVTPHSLDLLSETLENNEDFALVCPFSNNSPLLTYPTFPGRNYLQMADIFFLANKDSKHDTAIEACTIVGNCLMVKRDLFEHVGGFAPEWKEGYGEETELQMLATRLGLKGVVDLRTYVYHFGGGTFNYMENVDHLRLSNHQRFMERWRKEYLALERRTSQRGPLDVLASRLEQYYKAHPKASTRIDLDVLFYLPGLKQDIGGLSAVISICNALVRNGIRAGCAIVGPRPDLAELNFKEPVLFRFLLYSNDVEFLNDNVVLPKVVVSTIFTSAEIVAEFAQNRDCKAVQFVQGYEPFFENGTRSYEVISSYRNTDVVLTTSSWLASMVKRHLSDDQDLIRLPLVSNPDVFFPATSTRDIDICFVLRSAPDKGQWMLMEIFDRLRQGQHKFAILTAPNYVHLLKDIDADIEIIESPVDHYTLARLFRRVRIFVDASHHEGFGLLPLEAAMCGCSIVVSDSGGVRDINEIHPITIVPISASPEPFVDAVEAALSKAPIQLSDEYVSKAKHGFSDSQKKTQAWHDAVVELGKDITPKHYQLPTLTLPQKIPNEQPVTLQPGQLKRGFRETLRKVYSKIRPYLPRRLRIAMRYLILGR